MPALNSVGLRKTAGRATVLEQLPHQGDETKCVLLSKKDFVSFLFFASELPDLSAIHPQPIRAFVNGV